VDSAVGEQADEMEGSSFLAREVDGVGECGIGEEAAIGDGSVNAGHVHAHDASRAEIEMAHFGVAHLAVRQTNVVVAGTEESVGVGREEPVVRGLAGERDGVAVSLGAVAPAVEDGEDDGFWHMQESG
jgi:hypothetical protein